MCVTVWNHFSIESVSCTGSIYFAVMKFITSLIWLHIGLQEHNEEVETLLGINTEVHEGMCMNGCMIWLLLPTVQTNTRLTDFELQHIMSASRGGPSRTCVYALRTFQVQQATNFESTPRLWLTQEGCLRPLTSQIKQAWYLASKLHLHGCSESDEQQSLDTR